MEIISRKILKDLGFDTSAIEDIDWKFHIYNYVQSIDEDDFEEVEKELKFQEFTDEEIDYVFGEFEFNELEGFEEFYGYDE